MLSFMCWGYRLCPVMHETAQSHALRRKTSLRRLRFGSRRSRLFCTRYPRRRRYLKQSNCHIKQQAMVHAHRCRFPLACETHKVPNLFVLRSVLSRLRLHFPEQGPPFLPYHDVLPSLQILLTLPAQNFAAIAPALPSSSRRFSPCRWRLLFMTFSPRCHRVRAGSQGTCPRHCGAAPCPWSQEEAAGDEAQGRHHHQHVPARERSFVRAALH
jgi:hypothetical protein